MLPTPNPTVVFQKLDDGAVLFSAETETYFGLNEVGAIVWTLLPPAHRTLDEVSGALASRFVEVAMETIRADVQELLETLVREGLASPGAPPGDDAPAAP